VCFHQDYQKTDKKGKEADLMARKKTVAASIPPLFLTIPQVAQSLGLGRTKVYELINREGLPVVKFGRASRVPVARFQQWIAQREAS